MSISSCNSQISQYNSLKSKVSAVASNLDTAVNYLSSVMISLQNNYEINGSESTVYYKIKAEKEEMSGTSNYLKNTVSNSINSHISSLNAEIRRLEAEAAAAAAAAAAQAAAEAEAAAAAARASGSYW